MARPRTDIQPRIVRSARTRFLEEGVDGASLRKIAADAGTNVGMVVYYFPTKDDLFLAVVEEVYAKLLDDMAHLLAANTTVRERLERVFQRLGAASDDELQVVRLVAREGLVSSGRFGRVLARARRGHLPMFLAVLQEGVRRGEIDPTIPLPLLLVTTFGVGGLPQLIRRAAGDAPPFSLLPLADDLAAASIEMLFRAIEPLPRATRGRARKASERRR
jgi:AcrR family transcriptional regulator